MDYKYYFIVYSGPLPGGSGEEVTTLQLGSETDLGILESDAVGHWEGWDGEDTGEDPQIWDRSGESDATCVLGRGTDLAALTPKFYAAIKEKLGYNLPD